MPLSSVSLKTAPTSYTVTGGSALAVTPVFNDGDTVKLAATTDTDFRVRRVISHDHYEPKPSVKGPNGYTQERTRIFLAKPKLLANTKITTNYGQVILSWDVETTVAEKTEILDLLAQYLIDTNSRAAILAGATA